MSSPVAHFPFGSPLEARAPSSRTPRRLFVLGATPGALHVEWKPPAPFERVPALAVDNEPQPFWTAQDELAVVRAWARKAGWKNEWGTVGPAGALNGSSGQWLDTQVLEQLGAARADAWLTDCVDTYRFSRGQDAVVTAKFAPFAEKFGLAWAGVPPALVHPAEDTIVHEACKVHGARLRAEFKASQARTVVTLGDAALRVFSWLAGIDEPETLKPNKEYGASRKLSVEGRPVTWWPLMHPGQRNKEWLNAHRRWVHMLPRQGQAD